MARLFPDHPLKGCLSNAERKVFYALKEFLPEKYTVLHSIPIYHKSRETDILLDGEIDFLVICPEKGMIVIEVKGGGIGYDAKTAQWSSISFDGIIHKIKNPYEQGKNYLYALRNDLAKNPSTKNFNFPCGHAVWFPDIDLSDKKLGISVQLQNITLDRIDLPKAHKAIERLFIACLGEKNIKNPGSAGVKALVHYLAPSWEIRISLSSVLKEEEKVFYEATVSQFKVLSLLQRHNRALICGPAGTGKTFLALEKARRLAEDNNNFKVLLVCFNIRLAEKLRELIKKCTNVDVYHFHGLCSYFCKKANIAIPQPDPLVSNENYFKYDLPESLMNALCCTDERYDALIVDEGQDFDPAWWIPLEEVLRNPRSDIFYIFYDDNQILYERRMKFPIDDEAFHLFENCRNTKLIHQEVIKFYKGDTQPSAVGPEGLPPRIIQVKSEKEEKTVVENLIIELLNKENINPQDITLLTPSKEQNSLWESGALISGLKISWTTRGNNLIFCSTIHSFKGLESPIIIITEMNKLPSSSKDSLKYVAFSRARSYLVVIQS